MNDSQSIIWLFEALGFVAIAAGGLLAAFSARKPSRLTAWASAYLVLVAGLVQVGLAYGWSQLMPGSAILPRIGMVLFDLGNVLVLAGTIRRYRKGRANQAVNIGGGCLLVAMILLLWSQDFQDFSWTLVWYVVLVAVILVSMPIGLMLSSRRAS